MNVKNLAIGILVFTVLYIFFISDAFGFDPRYKFTVGGFGFGAFFILQIVRAVLVATNNDD